MKTKKQEELLNSYLSQLGDETRPLYKNIALYLSELGYNPKKEKSGISFKHDLHNKQMAKMGIKGNGCDPLFSLRFSACRGYSQRFADIVSAAAVKFSTRIARCKNASCDWCKGEADSHVYICTLPDGRKRYMCGAFTLEIPNIAENDIDEIKGLIKEEHEYLIKHEAGRD